MTMGAVLYFRISRYTQVRVLSLGIKVKKSRQWYLSDGGCLSLLMSQLEDSIDGCGCDGETTIELQEAPIDHLFPFGHFPGPLIWCLLVDQQKRDIMWNWERQTIASIVSPVDTFHRPHQPVPREIQSWQSTSLPLPYREERPQRGHSTDWMQHLAYNRRLLRSLPLGRGILSDSRSESLVERGLVNLENHLDECLSSVPSPWYWVDRRWWGHRTTSHCSHRPPWPLPPLWPSLREQSGRMTGKENG